jgi:hypothetical protein
LLGQNTIPFLGNGGLLHQTANHWRFGVANHRSYSDQLLAGMADRTAHSFGGLGCETVSIWWSGRKTVFFGGLPAQTTTDHMDCGCLQWQATTVHRLLHQTTKTQSAVRGLATQTTNDHLDCGCLLGQPPQFTVCCTKQLKRSSLLTALPPSFSRSFMRRWRLFSFAGTGLKLASRAISRGMVTG